MAKDQEKINDFCGDNFKRKQSVKKRLHYMKVNDLFPELTTLAKLDIIFEKIERKEQRIKIKECFQKLEKDISNKEYRKICEKLNIYWPHVRNLAYSGYSKKQIIKCIWYFSDKKTNDKLDITKKRLLDFYNNRVFMEENIYYYIALYRCEKEQFLENILKYENKYLLNYVNHISRSYSLTEDQKIELYQEAIFLLISTLSKIVLNNIASIIVYLHLVIRGNLIKYVQKNYKSFISFDESFMHINKEERYDF